MEKNNVKMGICERIAKELDLKSDYVYATVLLIEDNNTIPFIARYRKEITGNMDDQKLRKLNEKWSFYTRLEEKKKETAQLIEKLDLLTPQIKKAIEGCETLQELEDLYRPFRPKRKTRASVAVEKGLEPLALKILGQDMSSKELEEESERYVSSKAGIATGKEALDGAGDILAEYISDDAFLRKKIREIYFRTGQIKTKAKTKKESVYEMYYDYSEPVKKIPGHRVLAINRGEKEDFLQVKIIPDEEQLKSTVDGYVKAGKLYQNLQKSSTEKEKTFCRPVLSEACFDVLKHAGEDSIKRLIRPSVEKEIRNILTERACEKAVGIFGENLKNILMESPVKDRTVMGFDPAYRTGCKLAVVDSTGKCLATSVIYPTPPQNKKEEAIRELKSLTEKFNVDIIAIGNGTASGESERFVSEFIKSLSSKKKPVYCVVNEAGASVYSASELGAQEFPDFDVSLRSAVSIARRLQDPMAELVKIDPKSIGVGQYQHDMNQKHLEESLKNVVEDCVNAVGVDINTASPSLLSYIAGINTTLSKNIVDYRVKKGVFRSRHELTEVPKLGPETFRQCAGFMRIPASEEMLDNTPVHPETYDAAKGLLKKLGNPEGEKIYPLARKYGFERLAKELSLGMPTLKDIVEGVSAPGRDPRGDDFEELKGEKPIDMKELKEGMVLKGVVRNVSAFGAFVDIGVHQDGLVHISELSDKFVKDPSEVVAAGQKVNVRILGVDLMKKRISLSMKNTGKNT